MKRVQGLFALLWMFPLYGGEWPRFRGPNGAGLGEATGIPVVFGPGKNQGWETAVPFGQSSPVVTGGRVLRTASEGGSLMTLAYDVKSGSELWRQELPISMGLGGAPVVSNGLVVMA